jgi:hypothetical protein
MDRRVPEKVLITEVALKTAWKSLNRLVLTRDEAPSLPRIDVQ